MAKGHTKLLFIRDAQMLVVRVPIIIVGLMIAGLPGVVYARVLTGLISTAVNMLLVKRLIGLPFFQQLGANFRALASVALMAAGVWGLSHGRSNIAVGPWPDRKVLIWSKSRNG